MVVGSVLKRCLNVPQLVRHMSRKPDPDATWDPAEDLDLKLYHEALRNEFLHYGYFDEIPEDAEDISLRQVKRAMERYADRLLELLPPDGRVLDVGCGTGGLLRKLLDAGYEAVGVTPNNAQVRYIGEALPAARVVQARFEDVPREDFAGRIDCIVMSESCQYIDPHEGMEQVQALLAPGGRWVISDYFRLREDTHNRSGHLQERFESQLSGHGLTITRRLDVTPHVLPTLAYIHALARLLYPLIDHTAAKFKLKNPTLGYLLDDVIEEYSGKIDLGTLDPQVFERDKRYMRYVIERAG